MKDLKFTITNELFKGFTEISNFLQVYKFYIENVIGKHKDEAVEDLIKNQMATIKSFSISHIEQIEKNLMNSIEEWKNKNKESKD